MQRPGHPQDRIQGTQSSLGLSLQRQDHAVSLPNPSTRPVLSFFLFFIDILSVQYYINYRYTIFWASQVAEVVKNLPANAGDVRDAGSIPGPGRCPGGSHGNLLQYVCLANIMDRGAWWAVVQRVTKSWTLLKQLSTHTDSSIVRVLWMNKLKGPNVNSIRKTKHRDFPDDPVAKTQLSQCRGPGSPHLSGN